MPTQKVEVGFDVTGTGGPFLVLDDPVSGRLDDADWVLGGTIFVDITSDVKAITLNRGKNVDIGTFSAGEIVVELNNQDRTYDPTYAASRFYGQIVPKREVRLSTNNIRQFTGVIDDWNLQYSVQGEANANFVASDGFVFFNNQTIGPGTATVQTSGERINSVLDDPAVSWPSSMRNIDTGVSTLGADVIQADTNVLTYLRLVEQSELGKLFIGKNGYATFLDRAVAITSTPAAVLADDGTGIGYKNLNIVYGSEQLANEIVVSSVITGDTVTAIDTDSQIAYGIFNLTLSDLLLNSTVQVEDLALFLAYKYSQPQYRIDSVDVSINDLSLANQNIILGLELGDVVKVTFTPSGIPPAIVKFAEVINIRHNTSLELQTITLGLATVDNTAFTLDDELFGRLDSDNSLGF